MTGRIFCVTPTCIRTRAKVPIDCTEWLCARCWKALTPATRRRHKFLLRMVRRAQRRVAKYGARFEHRLAMTLEHERAHWQACKDEAAMMRAMGVA